MSDETATSQGKSSRLALPKSLRLNKKNFSRRHSRFDCVLISSMKVIEIGAEFDGAIVELSLGGCTFRQASMFALDRIGQSVLIHNEFFETEGRIRAVRPEGYGVQFFNEIEEGIIDIIVKEYGFNVADSFLAKRN
jgi:PilZ domain